MGDAIIMAGKFTAERGRIACAERRKGATVRAAAAAAGVTHVTLHAWINRGTSGREPYATFQASWRQAENEYRTERFEQLRDSA